MKEIKNDEIDIFQIFKLIKETMKGWLVSIFNALDFIYKYKIVIIALIIVGIGLGYFSQIKYKPNQKATALIRVNFDSVDYVYTEIETINAKFKEKDSVFLINNGFRGDTLEVKKITISPIINVKDILEKYEVNDRKLEGLLRNLDFNDEEIELYQTFNSEYKFHKLEFSLTPVANKQTIKTIINYLNNETYLQQIKETILGGVKKQISENQHSISQINNVIDTYKTNGSLPSPSEQIFVVDKNFSIHVLFERKIDLQASTKDLQKYLASAEDIVMLVNKPNIIVEKEGVLGYKFIIYPLFLVFIFLLLSYFRYVFIKLKNIANESKSLNS